MDLGVLDGAHIEKANSLTLLTAIVEILRCNGLHEVKLLVSPYSDVNAKSFPNGFLRMLFVQLRIAPQNPKTPSSQALIPNHEMARVWTQVLSSFC